MPIRSFKYITDPKAISAVADETRRKIIYLLRAKEQTVSQLAESLGKTPQAIYHQIRKLTEAGLVEVAREERVGHFIETYYRATAEVFEFRHGESGAPPSGTGESAGEGGSAAIRSALKAVGVNLDKKKADQVNDLLGRVTSHTFDVQLEEKIMNLEDVDFISKQHGYYLATYAKMTDKQFDDMIAEMKQLRKLLTN